MGRSRFLRITAASAAAGVAAAVAFLVGQTPASAHTHPTPVDLVSPAVVYVETRGQVEVSLIEHNRAGRHIGLVQRTYTPLLATGSGFAVDGSGDIVTGGRVVRPDLNRAVVYAVNQLFHERYGKNAPLPSDPFSRQKIADVAANPVTGQFADPINQRLQRCYVPNTTDPTGGCVVTVRPVVHVFPYVTDQKQYGDLIATVQPGSTAQVAVLKVGASSMPTVDLATTSSDAKAVSVLGFTQVPSAAQPLSKKDAHLSQPGSKIVQDKDFAALQPLLQSGYRGGPVVGETGKVVGFFSSPQPQSGEKAAAATFVDAATIRSVLKAAKVTPRRGPADTAFESAMHYFKNNEFTGSIPGFQNTLKLYPGHFTATQDLRIADAKKGTAADKTGLGASVATTSGRGAAGVPWLWWTAIAAIVVLTVLVLAIAGRRVRRRRAASGVAEPSSAGPPRQAPAGTGRGQAPGAPGAGARPAHQAPGSRPPGQSPPAKVPATAPATQATGTQARPSSVKGVTPDTPAQRTPQPASARGPRGETSQRGAPVIARGVPGANSSPARAGADSASAHPGSDSAAADPVAGSAYTFCTNCGGRLSTHHRFCGWCGHPVG